MYNILLDRLPTEYKGYLVRTSFRIGMQICMCFGDASLDDTEKMSVALSLLYGNGVPADINTAIDGIKWFLSCGVEHKKSSSEKELLYWDFDSARIFSSFLSTYGVDLSKEDMHWFKFVAMIGSLRKDSALNSAIQIRAYDMKDLKGKARTDMQRLKGELTPEIEYTDEEKAVMEQFEAQLGGDVNG